MTSTPDSGVPTTMRAAVVTRLGEPLLVTEREIPAPGPGEVLVRLDTSGVCHTDLHAAHGDWPVKPQPPFIPGHEGCGTVVALGSGVDNLKVGDKVGNAWLWSVCGGCTTTSSPAWNVERSTAASSSTTADVSRGFCRCRLGGLK